MWWVCISNACLISIRTTAINCISRVVCCTNYTLDFIHFHSFVIDQEKRIKRSQRLLSNASAHLCQKTEEMTTVRAKVVAATRNQAGHKRATNFKTNGNKYHLRKKNVLYTVTSQLSGETAGIYVPTLRKSSLAWKQKVQQIRPSTSTFTRAPKTLTGLHFHHCHINTSLLSPLHK